MPSKPINFKAVPGDRSVKLTWWAPQSNGGSPITRYEIDGSSQWCSQWAALNKEKTVSNLANGIACTFKLRAVNAVGSSAWAKVGPVTPFAPPVS